MQLFFDSTSLFDLIPFHIQFDLTFEVVDFFDVEKFDYNDISLLLHKFNTIKCEKRRCV